MEPIKNNLKITNPPESLIVSIDIDPDTMMVQQVDSTHEDQCIERLYNSRNGMLI